jgi:hypothetical protein
LNHLAVFLAATGEVACVPTLAFAGITLNDPRHRIS